MLFGTQLFAQETTVSRFKLIPTKNMWIFIKLDTGNGRTWLVQFGTSEDNRLETVLDDKPLVLDPVPPAGRFELYPTEIHLTSFFLIRTLEPHIRFSGDLNIKTGLGYLYLGTVTLYGHVDIPL